MELCIRPVRVAQGQHKALRRISEAINPSDHVFERLDNQTSHETTKHKIPPGERRLLLPRHSQQEAEQP